MTNQPNLPESRYDQDGRRAEGCTTIREHLQTAGWISGGELLGAGMTGQARGAHLTALCAADPGDCVCGLPGDCSCSAPERALRFIAWGGQNTPLNAEQRAQCLNEIDAVGSLDPAVYELATDDELAHGVLDAWSTAAGADSPL